MARITERNTWTFVGALAVTAAVAGIGSARLDAQTQTPPQAQTVQVAPLPPAPGESFAWVAAQPIEKDVIIVTDDDQAGPPPEPAIAGKFNMFIGGDGKVVTGAPYAADAVTEMIQNLADGNRIVQRQSASVARDGQGRTRREMALAAIGPMMPEDPPRITFIHDPVAGVVYQFNDVKRTATRRTLPKHIEGETVQIEDGATAGVAFGAAGVVSYKARTHAMVKPHGEGGVEAGTMAVHIERGPEHGANTQTEALGTQTVEGVEATGTRTTTTIAAGTIGNEQPIKIVSESWYSPELQTMVMTKRSDPRFGETSYKLTNIVRADPSPALFEVPAGYTITDEPDILRLKMTRDQQPQPEPER